MSSPPLEIRRFRPRSELRMGQQEKDAFIDCPSEEIVTLIKLGADEAIKAELKAAQDRLRAAQDELRMTRDQLKMTQERLEAIQAHFSEVREWVGHDNELTLCDDCQEIVMKTTVTYICCGLQHEDRIVCEPCHDHHKIELACQQCHNAICHECDRNNQHMCENCGMNHCEEHHPPGSKMCPFCDEEDDFDEEDSRVYCQSEHEPNLGACRHCVPQELTPEEKRVRRAEEKICELNHVFGTNQCIHCSVES